MLNNTTMEEAIKYLQDKFSEAVVFPSTDKDYICVRSAYGDSLFYRNDQAKFNVNITKIDKYHIDTIKLMAIKSYVENI